MLLLCLHFNCICYLDLRYCSATPLVSHLFTFSDVGETSYLHMKDIVCKLADFMAKASDTVHVSVDESCSYCRNNGEG